MSQMEEKLGAILNDPQMMQQLMNMAQAFSASQPQPEQQKTSGREMSNSQRNGSQPPQTAQSAAPPAFPELNPQMLQALSAMASQSGADQNQQALLQALSPYLSQGRIQKLERAMRAAKLANAASGFLSAGGLQLLTGR